MVSRFHRSVQKIRDFSWVPPFGLCLVDRDFPSSVMFLKIRDIWTGKNTMESRHSTHVYHEYPGSALECVASQGLNFVGMTAANVVAKQNRYQPNATSHPHVCQHVCASTYSGPVQGGTGGQSRKSKFALFCSVKLCSCSFPLICRRSPRIKSSGWRHRGTSGFSLTST